MKQVSHFPVLVVPPAECCVQLSTIFFEIQYVWKPITHLKT